MQSPSSPNADPPGAWIFISHSHKDITGVRAIRDELECMGHQPLLFFLKCINDHDELDGLIKREIDARNFFLLCDSEASRSSNWVQREVAYIKSLPNRVVHTVDLGADSSVQVHAIRELSRQATVFMSYARSDWPLVAPIHDALVAAEYRVWQDLPSVESGETVQDQILDGLRKASHNGFVLLFLTNNSLASPWCREEMVAALQLRADHPRQGCIIPILLSGNLSPGLLPLLPEELGRIMFEDLSGLSPTEAGTRLIKCLRNWQKTS
jgi:hypothetical protein